MSRSTQQGLVATEQIELGERLRGDEGSQMVQLLRRLSRKPLGLSGAVLVLVMVLFALFAPALAFQDPNLIATKERLLAPSLRHPFGTDNFGRDVYSRIVWGSRTSLTVGVSAVLMAVGLGSLLGLVSGYFAGKTDLVLQRIMDSIMAFPALVLAMVIVAVLGPSITNVALTLGIVLMPTTNRVVRGAVLSAKENLYVEAARTIGCRELRILFLHVLPNVIAPIIILLSLDLGTAILVEASLSFLGLGPPPPNPTWGGMLSGEGRSYFRVAPWLPFFPGVAISLAVLGFNLFGDALRDLWDPRLRGT